MQGTVKFFNTMKRVGFIVGEDETEYFVHESGLTEGVTLNENDKVTFDVEQGDRGPKAVNVSLAGDAPEAEEPAEEESTEEAVEEAPAEDATEETVEE